MIYWLDESRPPVVYLLLIYFKGDREAVSHEELKALLDTLAPDLDE